jgi:hypothetical protein
VTGIEPAFSAAEEENERLKGRLADQIEETNKWRSRAKAWEDEVQKLQGSVQQLRRTPRTVKTNGHSSKVYSISELIDRVQKTPGFQVSKEPNNHYKVVPPEGDVVYIASTPGSQQYLRTARQKLAKIGVPL